MRLNITAAIHLFSDAQLEHLLQNALTVLRQTPFRVQGTDEFCDHLRAYGCQVDSEQVRFPQAVIDKVMARCAEAKRAALEALRAQGGKPEQPGTKVSMFTHGQALHICDLETNQLRPATELDLATWCHAADSLDIPTRAHPTFIPTDVPVSAADFHAFATIILNSRQPHRVSVYSARMLPFFIEAATIATGSLDAVKRDPVFATKAWVTSPFMIDRENIDIGMEARRRLGTPITFGHMPVAAASTPVSVAGALVQNTAESLALSAMRLAIDNLPQGITGSAAVMDMKHGFPRQLGPDMFLHSLAGQEMNDYLYHGYSTVRGFGYTGTGAATVSTQSVCEKALGVAFGAATGARDFGIGCLAFSDVGSPVHLILDRELVGFVEHLLRDVSIDDEHIGLNNIIETVPTGGRYMENLHTAQFFREECWLPSLIDYRAFMAWASNPSDMIADARKKARNLFSGATNHCPLSDDQQRAIRKLMQDADAAARG
ncbi:MAG: hypothetical protein A3K18_06505 [Lentisphaerae bacterium RIFOXYA12_64_32]|nr:MAG: hypothetical protein A3K18_06505 [Lentisphaerae bacterium RIFOXYA12_64_32]